MLLSRNIFQTAIAVIQVKNPSHQPSISNLSFKMLEISAKSSYKCQFTAGSMAGKWTG